MLWLQIVLTIQMWLFVNIRNVQCTYLREEKIYNVECRISGGIDNGRERNLTLLIGEVVPLDGSRSGTSLKGCTNDLCHILLPPRYLTVKPAWEMDQQIHVTSTWLRGIRFSTSSVSWVLLTPMVTRHPNYIQSILIIHSPYKMSFYKPIHFTLIILHLLR